MFLYGIILLIARCSYSVIYTLEYHKASDAYVKIENRNMQLQQLITAFRNHTGLRIISFDTAIVSKF